MQTRRSSYRLALRRDRLTARSRQRTSRKPCSPSHNPANDHPRRWQSRKARPAKSECAEAATRVGGRRCAPSSVTAVAPSTRLTRRSSADHADQRHDRHCPEPRQLRLARLGRSLQGRRDFHANPRSRAPLAQPGLSRGDRPRRAGHLGWFRAGPRADRLGHKYHRHRTGKRRSGDQAEAQDPLSRNGQPSARLTLIRPSRQKALHRATTLNATSQILPAISRAIWQDDAHQGVWGVPVAWDERSAYQYPHGRADRERTPPELLPCGPPRRNAPLRALEPEAQQGSIGASRGA